MAIQVTATALPEVKTRPFGPAYLRSGGRNCIGRDPHEDGEVIFV